MILRSDLLSCDYLQVFFIKAESNEQTVPGEEAVVCVPNTLAIEISTLLSSITNTLVKERLNVGNGVVYKLYTCITIASQLLSH